MRILLAHATYRIPGGEDRYVEQITELLGTRHDVELFRTDNSKLTGSIEAAGRMLRPKAMTARLDGAVGRFAPDLIHVHNVYPSLGAAPHLVARRRSVPLVMTVHNHRLRCPNGYRFTEGQVCSRCVRGNYTHALRHRCFPTSAQATGYASALWTDRFVRRIERAVTRFIAPSRYMAAQLDGWGVRAPVDVVRNFTDARTEPGVPGASGFFTGRLSSEKGVDVLLRALAEAGDPPFDILGDGPLIEPLKQLAAKLELQNVLFNGRVGRSEIERVAGEARYFVMPSLSDENAPLAVFEALARGVPAIVTDRGGLPELEQQVVPANNARAMASAITELRRDDGLHRRLSDKALAFARSELSPQVHLERLEGTYEAALASSGR